MLQCKSTIPAGGVIPDGVEGSVPQEWKDILVVPTPKIGDLSLCNKWMGIS